MIAENNTDRVQEVLDLEKQILKAESDLARLAAKLEEIKSGAAALVSAGKVPQTVSFEEASAHVRTDYSHLLQQLSQ